VCVSRRARELLDDGVDERFVRAQDNAPIGCACCACESVRAGEGAPRWWPPPSRERTSLSYRTGVAHPLFKVVDAPPPPARPPPFQRRAPYSPTSSANKACSWCVITTKSERG
jgi:hypothetical protein